MKEDGLSDMQMEGVVLYVQSGNGSDRPTPFYTKSGTFQKFAA